MLYSGDGIRGYGKLVIVKHNRAYISVYAHNSQLLVKEGQNGSRDVYRSGATPWFGLRLRCGNSLIGSGLECIWDDFAIINAAHYAGSKSSQNNGSYHGRAKATT